MRSKYEIEIIELDVVLRDEATNHPNRPKIVVLVDEFSRMPLAYDLKLR